MSAHSAPTPIRGDLDDEFFDDDEFLDDENSGFDDDYEDGAVDGGDFESGNDHYSSSFTDRSGPSNGRRAWRWVARVLLVAVVAVLGVGAYLVWPTINERYIQPVETTAAELDTVEGRINQLDASSADFETIATELGDRITNIETVQDDTTSRLDGLDDLIALQTTRLDGLDQLVETLGTDLDETNAEATRQLEVTRAAELMSRARLFLFQANYGLAAADLNAAQVTLAGLEADNNFEGDTELSEVLDRLDRSVAALPDFPVSAASDLDIAWQTLLGNQPAPSTLPFRTSDGPDEEASTETGSTETNGEIDAVENADSLE